MNLFMRHIVTILVLFVFLIGTKSEAQNCQAYFTSFNSSGNTVQFMDSSWANTGNVSYYWNFGNGDTANISNPNYTYNQAGSYVVCLTISTSLGCQDTYCDSILVGSIINPPCNVSYSYTADTSNIAYFSSSTSGSGPFTYNWNFGDGNSSTLANPTHQYSAASSYGVSLIVTDSRGTNCSYYDTVHVNYCSPYFLYNISPSGSVSFRNYSITSRSSSFLWNFGDGNTSNLKNPIHTYQNSGSYVVSLTSFDSLSFCTNTFYDSLVINLPPRCQAGFGYQVNQGQVSFQDSASNYTLISYDFGDGNTSNQPSPTHTYSQSGTYLVCQTVSDSTSQCSNTFCDTIIVSIPPPCSAGFNYNLNQANLSITNTATNFSSISYDFGDGSTSTSLNPSHNYASSGTYIVCQSIGNPSGCNDMYCDTINVNITPPCIANFAYSINVDTINVVDLSTNTDSVLYDYGDGTTSNNISHIYSQGGTYTVCQIAYGANGCVSSICDSVQITIPTCNAGFSYQQLGDTIQFTNQATNYTSISYDLGDGTVTGNENPSHQYMNSGTYIVKQTAMNINRVCVDVFTDTISINISTSCVAKFLVAIDTNNRGTLFIVNTSTNDPTHQYNWSFGDGSFGTGRLPTHTYQENKAHEICLTITDSVMNCTSTFCDTVGLDSNGNILKAKGYSLKVLEGDFIGIPEENKLESLSIYPNPFSKRLMFDYKNSSQLEYELLNINGKLLMQGELFNNELNLPEIRPGIYFLWLSDGENSIVRKLIKQDF